MALNIENWITENPLTIDCKQALSIGIAEMAKLNVGAILVEENGRLAGILTERDLLKLFASIDGQKADDVLRKPIEQFMTKNPISGQIDEDFNTVYDKMQTHHIRHIPIKDNEELVGIVSIRDLMHYYQHNLEDSYLDAQRQLEELQKSVEVSSVQELSKVVAELERFKRLSLTDELTGLYNKRYFNSRLLEEVKRAKRHDHALALVFCDLDFFKRVNDDFGHPCGDEVLKKTASLLTGELGDFSVMHRLRKSDIVARYGGEEFVVILPETSKEGALITAEKMRKTIEDFNFSCGDQELRVTMSFGVTQLTAECQSCDEIIKNADHAMYKSKEGGRNRVESHP